MRKALSFICASLAFGVLMAGPASSQSGEGDPAVLAFMRAINEQLRAAGSNIVVEQIDAFTIGGGRPSNRIHQSGFRWMAGDPRRLAEATTSPIWSIIAMAQRRAASRMRRPRRLSIAQSTRGRTRARSGRSI
jgi:hypothetical protein